MAVARAVVEVEVTKVAAEKVAVAIMAVEGVAVCVEVV